MYLMLRNFVNNILKFCKIKIIESAVNVIAIDSASQFYSVFSSIVGTNLKSFVG